MFFPGGTQPSWKITEIPGGKEEGGGWQAPPGMEILHSRIPGGSGI